MSVTFLTNIDRKELEELIEDSGGGGVDDVVVDSKVSEHNTSDAAHQDVRLLIEELTTRLNAVADSEDVDLDQLSELVTYIKTNRTLIEQVTTNKVNVSDIIDNLTTSVSNKPLSAKQGVELKKLIDAIVVPTKLSALTDDVGYAKQTEVETLSDDITGLTKKLEAEKTARINNVDSINEDISNLSKEIDDLNIPTKVSELENDSGYLTQHQSLTDYAKKSEIPTDYVTSTTFNSHKSDTTHITSAERTSWNNKSNFSGSYNDLTNKPTIPSLTGYATETYVTNYAQPKGNYLTSVPSEYVTETELNAKGYAKNSDVEKYETLTLGVHTDGLIYIFKNSQPMGVGVEMGVSGDVVGYIDANNNIVLSGDLGEETYTVKYEMEDGTLMDIGELSLVPEPTYTNLADSKSSDWAENYRLNSSGASVANDGTTVTNFIPVVNGNVIRIKGLDMSASTGRIAFYNSSKTSLTSATISATSYVTNKSLTKDLSSFTIAYTNNDVAFVRFSAPLTGTSADVIITKNEEIA